MSILQKSIWNFYPEGYQGSRPAKMTQPDFPWTSPWCWLVERKLPRKPELAKPELAESDDMPNSGRGDNPMAPEDLWTSTGVVACRVGQLWNNTPFWIILYLVTCNNEHNLVCKKTRQNVDQVWLHRPFRWFQKCANAFWAPCTCFISSEDRYTKPTAAKLYWDSPRRTACWQTIALEMAFLACIWMAKV